MMLKIHEMNRLMFDVTGKTEVPSLGSLAHKVFAPSYYHEKVDSSVAIFMETSNFFPPMILLFLEARALRSLRQAKEELCIAEEKNYAV